MYNNTEIINKINKIVESESDIDVLSIVKMLQESNKDILDAAYEIDQLVFKLLNKLKRSINKLEIIKTIGE